VRPVLLARVGCYAGVRKVQVLQTLRPVQGPSRQRYTMRAGAGMMVGNRRRLIKEEPVASQDGPKYVPARRVLCVQCAHVAWWLTLLARVQNRHGWQIVAGRPRAQRSLTAP
jgi:hypothetical protein